MVFSILTGILALLTMIGIYYPLRLELAGKLQPYTWICSNIVTIPLFLWVHSHGW